MTFARQVGEDFVSTQDVLLTHKELCLLSQALQIKSDPHQVPSSYNHPTIRTHQKRRTFDSKCVALKSSYNEQ